MEVSNPIFPLYKQSFSVTKELYNVIIDLIIIYL